MLGRGNNGRKPNLGEATCLKGHGWNTKRHFVERSPGIDEKALNPQQDGADCLPRKNKKSRIFGG
jgi:hypothetical protein